MKIISCQSCQARMDVTSVEPGSQIICGGCRNLVVVPGGAASGAGSPSVGRPRQARPRQERPRPERPAPAPRSTGRAASARRDRHAPRGGGGGPAKIIVAAVGVLFLGAALFMMMSSDDGGGDGTGTAGPVAETDPVVPQPTYAEKLAAWQMDAANARTAADWRRLGESAKDEGFRAQSREARAKLFELAPQDDWANQDVGNVKRTYRLFGEPQGVTDQERSEIDLLETYVSDGRLELAKLLEEAKAVPGEFWLSPKAAERFDELVAAEAEHLEELKTSRRSRMTWKWRQSTRQDPIFKHYPFEVNGESAPFLVFAQAGSIEDDGTVHVPTASESFEAKSIVRRNGKLLRRLYDVFNTTILEELRKVEGDDFVLPQFDGDDEETCHVLKTWVFFRREDFDAYQTKVSGTTLPGVAGYYSPMNQWVTLFEELGRKERKDFNRNKVIHEGTHQLMHYYKKALVEKETGREVPWTHGALSSDLHFFQEGFCELLGSARWNVRKNTWDLLELSTRLDGFRAMARANEINPDHPRWSLAELVTARDRGQMTRWAIQKARGDEEDSQRLQGAFYAHSWAFSYFLWYAGRGQYRPAFVKYLALELRGKSGSEHFKKLMEPWAPDGDFSNLEVEFEAWMKRL